MNKWKQVSIKHKERKYEYRTIYTNRKRGTIDCFISAKRVLRKREGGCLTNG